MTRDPRWRLVFVVALVVFVLDRGTKVLVEQTMALEQTIEILPFFALTYVRNPGAAFGLFRNAPEAYRIPLLLGVTVVAFVVLLGYLRETPAERRWIIAALGGVLGGAVGNLRRSVPGHKGHKPSPVKALIIAVKHFIRLALHALDYCPPADLPFAEYAIAMLVADRIAYPVDRFRYREIVANVFGSRGIITSPKDLYPASMPVNTDFNLLSARPCQNLTLPPTVSWTQTARTPVFRDYQSVQITGFYSNAKTGDYNYKLPPERVVSYCWEEEVPLKGKTGAGGHGPGLLDRGSARPV